MAMRADQCRGTNYRTLHAFCIGLSLCSRGHVVYHDDEWWQVFCFADKSRADSFRVRFGGEHFDLKDRGRGRRWHRWNRKGSGAMANGHNRIMIFGPKDDGNYVVEFRTAAQDSLAIAVPQDEAAVLKHFQARMPYGLVVRDLQSADSTVMAREAHSGQPASCSSWEAR